MYNNISLNYEFLVVIKHYVPSHCNKNVTKHDIKQEKLQKTGAKTKLPLVGLKQTLPSLIGCVLSSFSPSKNFFS